MEERKFCISGLSKLDKLELQSDSDFSFEEIRIPDGAHGEVATFIAILTMAGISTLAAYLLRKSNKEYFEEIIEEVLPDGTRKMHKIKWSKDSKEAPEASILKQIQQGYSGM